LEINGALELINDNFLERSGAHIPKILLKGGKENFKMRTKKSETIGGKVKKIGQDWGNEEECLPSRAQAGQTSHKRGGNRKKRERTRENYRGDLC